MPLHVLSVAERTEIPGTLDNLSSLPPERTPGGFISDYGKSLVAGPVLGGLREFCHSVFEPINWKREMATNVLATSDGSGAASNLAAALSGLHLTDHLLPVEGDAPTLTSEPTLKDLGRPNLFHGTDDAWTESQGSQAS